MKKNVLIFPSGSENAMEIYDSLKYNIHFELFGISSNNDHTSFLYKNYKIGNYKIDQVDFINNLNMYLHENNIDYIFPTHDTIALFLMENGKKIDAEIICSPLETTKIAYSKKMTYDCLKEKYFSPKVFINSEFIEKYPIFLKPDVSAGGKGCKVINDETELKFYSNKKNILMEYLPGEEYTIDCFTDRNRNLLFSGVRIRSRINMGISFQTYTIKQDEEFKKIAEELNKIFIFRGAWFFQVKKDINGKLKLMEFSVRQAGTMALYRELGVNFALLSLFDRMNYDLKILFNNYNLILDRRLKNSYKLDYEYDTIYIDFDDTIIVDKEVNLLAISFLYYCINKRKKIFLITKHENDILEDLEKWHISKNIFTKIIHIKDNSEKYEYVKHSKSIFIDNYFKDREMVSINCKIPVFDVDAIECLFDL